MKRIVGQEREGGKVPRNKKLPNKKGKTDEQPATFNRDRSRGRSSSSTSSSSRTTVKRQPPKNAAQKARRLTNGIIRGEVRDLKAQRREVNQSADNANALTETQYTRGVGDLTAVRDETTEFINRMNAQNQSTFDTSKMQETAAAAALQQQLGGIYGKEQSAMGSELGQLGLDPSQFSSQLSDDAANAQGVGAINAATSQSNLSLANQNSGQLGSLLQGMAQGSFISHLGQNLNSRNDSLAETGQERIDQLGLVREAIADAKGSRKDVFFELLNQLQQTGWTPKSSSKSRSSSGGSSDGNKRELPKQTGKPTGPPKGKTAVVRRQPRARVYSENQWRERNKNK